jgi:hypothetical protein
MRYGHLMTPLFISDRLALSDADDLIGRFGKEAAVEAAARAAKSRDEGNVRRFCHWRQIARVITALNTDEVQGTVH